MTRLELPDGLEQKAVLVIDNDLKFLLIEKIANFFEGFFVIS